MTFGEQLKDAFNRFFGVMDEPMPIWKTLAIFALLIGVVIMCVWCGREKSEPEDEPEEIEIQNPVAIKRQPAEIFETDCDLDLLSEQLNAMGHYLHVLEIRAEIERIEL